MAYTSAHRQRGKRTFDDIYDEPDPRPFFRTLSRYDYGIPGEAQQLFSRLVDLRATRGPVTVTDLCCSYGINAALLKHDVTLDDLYDRYCSTDLDGLSSDQLAEADARFYAERRRSPSPRVVGLDTARNAVAYGVRTGLLDAGWADNLERDEPSPGLAADLADTGLVTVTGGVGYIGPRTFDAVLSRVHAPTPWVAAFALRWVDFSPIEVVLAHHGLATERYGGRTFPQRRFADEAEQDYAVRTLTEMGIDPEGRETEGSYHADLYVARLKDEATERPLDVWLDRDVQPMWG